MSAVSVFEDGLQRGLIFDVEEWTCLISAYTEHGMINEAQSTLERMVAVGVNPNEATALCLLNAASHGGLGLGVRHLHDQLQHRFPHLQLNALHRSCVIDGLARVGLFDEAVDEAHEL